MAFVTELLGYIGLDVDDASFNDAEQSVRDVTKVMAGLVTIAASVATAVTGAAYAMVNDFANTATEIDQLTKRLNVNAEAFQATAYAAKSFGIEQDQLADGMKELSMRAGEFALTGEGSFKDVASQLGLTRAQVKSYGNDVNGLFDLVRNKLAGIQNQGQRQFLADALFGGGLADVGGEFFSQTSANIEALQKQAQESGLVISQETIDMAREYTREMDSLQARIKGLWNIVASNLLPVFTRITRQAKEFFDLHGEDIVDGLTAAINGLITAIKYLGVAAAIAMPYLIGSAAIASWAKLIALTNTLTGAFLAMRTGALLAWAAAAAGPVLVGLAIGALILAIQDVYTYFTGGDSITGRIIESFKGMDSSIRGIWDGLVDYIIGALGRIDKAIYNSMPEWMQELMTFASGGSYNPNRNYNTQSNLQSDIPGHERIPGYAEIVSGENRQADIPGHERVPFNGITAPQVLVPPRITVTAPPTMAQGMAQANAGRGNVITTNSGNTTVGEIIVNGAENPVATAQAIRQELRRDNASRTKGSDTGVKY
ncbi:hypothetical protein EBL29_21315 [Salmonella enterica subsp. enterica serovar Cerro]|nr:hypothetical protein [Salmonella enterica subsp. enterica serovar Cerro]